MICQVSAGFLLGEGSPETFSVAVAPCGINKYVISGQNVKAKRWAGTSPDDPTHLCSSLGGVTGSPTASLCVPLSSSETRLWWGSKHSRVLASLLYVLKGKINQPTRSSSNGVLLMCALNRPLIKFREYLDGTGFLSA